MANSRYFGVSKRRYVVFLEENGVFGAELFPHGRRVVPEADAVLSLSLGSWVDLGSWQRMVFRGDDRFMGDFGGNPALRLRAAGRLAIWRTVGRADFFHGGIFFLMTLARSPVVIRLVLRERRAFLGVKKGVSGELFHLFE